MTASPSTWCEPLSPHPLHTPHLIMSFLPRLKTFNGSLLISNSIREFAPKVLYVLPLPRVQALALSNMESLATCGYLH